MLIGGFIKQSFIDYPGKMAAVVFTAGCNYRCNYCHNPQLVYPELIRKSTTIDPKFILDYLFERKNWLDGVVVTGGEPTLQKQLIPFINEIKSMNYKVKLDTNGSNPRILSMVIDQQLVDYIAMDIKAPLSLHGYRKIIGVEISGKELDAVKESIGIIKHSGIGHHFRTTLDPLIGAIEQEEISKALAEEIVWQQVQNRGEAGN